MEGFEGFEGFELVYQGGHHDVYCNGTRHIWLDGGYCRILPPKFSREGKCDCAYWKRFNERLKGLRRRDVAI